MASSISSLAGVRLIGAPVHWLSDPALALTSVTIANIWFGMPFSMILIAAALTAIPQEHYEAAALDGAGAFARFRYVTLPALTPTLLAVACLVTIYTMRAFDLIFAMTQGGPLDASNVLPLLSYQFSFLQFQFGVGAAIGTFAFFIVFGVALALRAHAEARRRTYDGRHRASAPTRINQPGPDRRSACSASRSICSRSTGCSPPA